MTNTEINRILKRIQKARKHCKTVLEDSNSTEEQKREAKLFDNKLKGFIEGMCQYTCNVFRDNYKNFAREEMRESFADVQDYQNECEEIEKTRKSSHDSLIVNIKIVDALCEKAGLEEIYGELPEQYKKDTSGLMGAENRTKPGVVATRHAIADWTFDFILGCTVGMYLDLGKYNESLEDYEKAASNMGGEHRTKNALFELTDPDL